MREVQNAALEGLQYLTALPPTVKTSQPDFVNHALGDAQGSSHVFIDSDGPLGLSAGHSICDYGITQLAMLRQLS